MSELTETETSVVQKNVEIMRLRLENTALLAALERAESDLDVALEQVRAAIDKVTDEIIRNR